MHLTRRSPRHRFPSLPAAAAAGLALFAGCYDSHPTPLDGDRPDVPDARDDAGGFPGVRFDPDVEAPAPGTLWLEEESATGSSITLRLMVDADEPAFGVAARLRWDAARLALHGIRSCGTFDRDGVALLDWKVVGSGDEVWFGLASPTREMPADVRGGACAVFADFEILGPGTSRLELAGERSAAVGSPPTRYLTRSVGGGTLEVTR
ncbi:MAG: hypothetical protein JXB32_00030 [Deltaproteobacteria bacterium]|nr:hypothetical protein [Deltaproteobacteria bacterium]